MLPVMAEANRALAMPVSHDEPGQVSGATLVSHARATSGARGSQSRHAPQSSREVGTFSPPIAADAVAVEHGSFGGIERTLNRKLPRNNYCEVVAILTIVANRAPQFYWNLTGH
jgi:hypothetical protein